VSVHLDGYRDPAFAPLRDALATNLAEGLDVGAAVAVSRKGRLLADLWGGEAAPGKPWRRESIANVFSTTKAVTALMVAILADRGRLAYDQPVARYWPEFAAAGKEAVTVECMMAHMAGLTGPRTEVSLDDLYAWQPYTDALAASAPWWPPGSQHSYHPISFGNLAGELIRRIDGRMPGRFLAEELAGPLGLNFYIGVPEAAIDGIAPLIGGPGVADMVRPEMPDFAAVGYNNPKISWELANTAAWRKAELPGANGHDDARSLAQLFDAALSGKIVSAAGLKAATAERFIGEDAADGTPTRFAAGFMLNQPARSFFTGFPEAFGHSGFGGAFVFADPEAEIACAYVPNHLIVTEDGVDPRRQRIFEALKEAL